MLIFASHAQARELTDATGARVIVPEIPQRIVTLAPSLGELAADVAGERLSRIVGVSEYTDYPPALKKKPVIGPYQHFNIEKIVSLKPDLILATSDGNSRDEVLHLRELGLPVVVVRTETFAQIEESMRLVSQAMGNSTLGETMSDQFAKGLERIRARSAEMVRKYGKKRVLIELGDDPLVVVGGKAFLNEALESLGGDNVYGELKTHYPRPSLEDVVRRDPDVIVVLSLNEKTDEFREFAARWRRFPNLKAVQHHQVRVLEGNSILRPSLRLLEGLSRLEKAVYGSP